MTSVRKRLFVTLVNLQNDQIRYGKLLAKLAEEITWNTLFVDLIGAYNIRRKGKKIKLTPRSLYEDWSCDRIV